MARQRLGRRNRKAKAVKQHLAPPGLDHELARERLHRRGLQRPQHDALVQRVAGHDLPVVEAAEAERLALRHRGSGNRSAYEHMTGRITPADAAAEGREATVSSRPAAAAQAGISCPASGTQSSRHTEHSGATTADLAPGGQSTTRTNLLQPNRPGRRNGPCQEKRTQSMPTCVWYRRSVSKPKDSTTGSSALTR